jgi:hypothetical protein
VTQGLEILFRTLTPFIMIYHGVTLRGKLLQNFLKVRRKLRWCRQLAHETDHAKIAQLLTDAVHRVLHELAKAYESDDWREENLTYGADPDLVPPTPEKNGNQNETEQLAEFGFDNDQR